MPKHIQVAVTFGDRKITLEGPEAFVREEIERLAKLSGGSQPVAQVTEAISPPDRSENASSTERGLVSDKRPKGYAQVVAVLAFCLTQNGKPEFSPDDIRRAFIRAGVRPPKVVSQALYDAKNRYDFVEFASRKGMFKLSPHGERTVLFDLPKVR